MIKFSNYYIRQKGIASTSLNRRLIQFDSTNLFSTNELDVNDDAWIARKRDEFLKRSGRVHLRFVAHDRPCRPSARARSIFARVIPRTSYLRGEAEARRTASGLLGKYRASSNVAPQRTYVYIPVYRSSVIAARKRAARAFTFRALTQACDRARGVNVRPARA